MIIKTMPTKPRKTHAKDTKQKNLTTAKKYSNQESKETYSVLVSFPIRAEVSVM